MAADNARTRADTGADAGLVRDAEAELYAGDPAGFIERRGDLAARARASGERAAAKAIAALRKPTRSAWVVNRLAHSDPDALSRLTALGEDLREAARALDGGRLRELSRARRDLIARLTRQALTGAGQHDAPDALRDEVTATLSAAVADPEVAAELAAGTLVRPVERSGFGFDPAAPLPDIAPPARKDRAREGRPANTQAANTQAGNTQAKRAQAERARAEREEAERARAERERAARAQAITAAEQAVDEAGQAAEAAESAERTCDEAVRDLERRLDDAHDRLAGAKRASRAAAAALRDARRALDRLRRHEPA